MTRLKDAGGIEPMTTTGGIIANSTDEGRFGRF
jgi:hypothetical protein